MGMLDRYRKSGGFVQLLQLIETCGPVKQEKFLEIIRSEDPRWADLIRTKILDMNRIYSWSEEVLGEIIGTLQDLTLATAIHAASEENKEKIFRQLSHARRRKIDDILETSNPSPQEIATTHMKVIETVRKMAIEGYLRFDKCDPNLMIEDEIEEKLSKSSLLADLPHIAMLDSNHENTASEKSDSNSSADGDAKVAEIVTLKKKLLDLSKENANLRHELSVARGKLDQIKKIA